MARPISQVPWLNTKANGRWYAFWYNQEKRRTDAKSLDTRDAGEAQTRFAAFLTNQGAFTSRQLGPRLTVSEALDQYWREHGSTNIVDRGRQERIILRLKEWFGDTAISDVDEIKCDEYVHARRSGALGGGKKHTRRPTLKGADSTIVRELTVIKTAANHAMNKKRLGPTANPPTPMPVVSLPKFASRETLWLTKDELEKVLRWADPDLLDFIMVAYYTAGRRRSIENLTPFQVNLQHGTINLRRPDETPQQKVSKKRRPIVPIDDELRPTIERLLASNAGTGWLFGKQTNFYLSFSTLLKKIGLGHKSFPHILRHSRATHLLQSGKVSLFHVAQLLGDTEKTVEKTYRHACVHNLGDVLRAAGGRNN